MDERGRGLSGFVDRGPPDAVSMQGRARCTTTSWPATTSSTRPGECRRRAPQRRALHESRRRLRSETYHHRRWRCWRWCRGPPLEPDARHDLHEVRTDESASDGAALEHDVAAALASLQRDPDIQGPAEVGRLGRDRVRTGIEVREPEAATIGARRSLHDLPRRRPHRSVHARCVVRVAAFDLHRDVAHDCEPAGGGPGRLGP